MSTGTSAFSVTRDQLIESSLRTLRVLRETDVPNASQIANANQTLNILLKNMQSNGLDLWTYTTIVVPMVIGQSVYTIGPSGADVTSVRPLRLFDGSYIRDLSVTPYVDTPLRIISRREYMQFGVKSIEGVPNSIYYSPTIEIADGTTNPATGWGTLYVYTAPSQTTRSLYLNMQRPIYDMDTASDVFDLPQEWFRCLKFMLAGELAWEYPKVDPGYAREVRAMGRDLQNELQSWSVEDSPVYFQPDQMNYRNR